MSNLVIYFHNGREPVTIRDAMECKVRDGVLTITHWDGGFVSDYARPFKDISEIHVDPKEERNNELSSEIRH